MSSQAVFRIVETGDIMVGALQGEIDVSNAAEVNQAIVSTITNEPLGLILDLAGVSYLDSSGLGMLFGLKRALATRRQRLVLLLPDASPLRRLFHVVKLEAVIPVADSLDRARAVGSKPEPAETDPATA